MTITAKAGDGTLLIGARTQGPVEFSQTHTHFVTVNAVSTGIDDTTYAAGEMAGTTAFQWSSVVSAAGDQGVIRAANISINSAPAQAPTFILHLFSDSIGAQVNHAVPPSVISIAEARTAIGTILFPVSDFEVSNAASWCNVADLWLPFTPNATELYGYLQVPAGATSFTLSAVTGAGIEINLQIEQA